MKTIIAAFATVATLVSLGSAANATDYGAIARYGQCMQGQQRAINAINPSLAKLAGPNAGHKKCAARAPYAGIRR